MDINSFVMGFSMGKKKGGSGGGVIEPITIKQNGTYNATDGVDGYAPITVDVAGSGCGGDSIVVDVDAFPTENVDNEKIYKMTKTIPGVQVLVNYEGTLVSLIDLFAEEMGAQLTLEVVTELPSSITMPTDGSFPGYILRESGEVCVFANETMALPLTQIAGIPFGGIISDVSEASDPAYYTMFGDDRILVSYGVPDVHNAREVYEYNESDGWVNTSDAVETVKKNYPFVAFVKECTVVNDSGTITLSHIGKENVVTDICIPSWVYAISTSVDSNPNNKAKRHEDDYGFYWKNEQGSNYVLLESKLATDVENITIPEGVRIIHNAFNNYTSVKQLDLSGYTLRDIVGFNNCTSLESVIFPWSVQHLDGFSGCSNLKTVTFKRTPNRIELYTFHNCPNLTDIYVPWAEGAVANAPWGATNATIHYNHTS